MSLFSVNKSLNNLSPTFLPFMYDAADPGALLNKPPPPPPPPRPPPPPPPPAAAGLSPAGGGGASGPPAPGGPKPPPLGLKIPSRSERNRALARGSRMTV